MLIVLGLVALLATMVISIATRIDNQSKEKSVETLFKILEGALEEYKEFHGDYPVQPVKDFRLPQVHSGFLYTELNSVPGCREILDKAGDIPIPVFIDPWDWPLDYRYAATDNYPELVSSGPDREFGTVDDITNKNK